jgi:hypothetical protein
MMGQKDWRRNIDRPKQKKGNKNREGFLSY